MLLYHLSTHPFSDTYSLIHRDTGFYAKFIACKTLFSSILQPVTGFRTYSRPTPMEQFRGHWLTSLHPEDHKVCCGLVESYCTCKVLAPQ